MRWRTNRSTRSPRATPRAAAAVLCGGLPKQNVAHPLAAVLADPPRKGGRPIRTPAMIVTGLMRECKEHERRDTFFPAFAGCSAEAPGLGEARRVCDRARWSTCAATAQSNAR